jgi:hemerythrin-like domain-containing protein
MPNPATPKIIRAEHQALCALLRSMTAMVQEARRRGRAPDFDAMRAMLFYVDEFPERLHHVKESAMLFPRLREIVPECAALLDRLDREHDQGEKRIRHLEHALTAWELLGDARAADFETALERYVAFYLEHMRIEESEVLPLAEQRFSEDDWRILDRAFGAHRDALTGAQPEAPYAQLFRTIAESAPLLPGASTDG